MGPLHGSRILIVEDDYLIAADLRQLVEQAGGTVTAQIARQTQADLCANLELDAAVLDVQLADGFADPIARQLQDRHIPFVVVTGYEHGTLPSCLQKAPYMQKPIERDQLVAAVERCVQLSRQQRLEAERRRSRG
jgi:DNA-binding NtrC family response regulator